MTAPALAWGPTRLSRPRRAVAVLAVLGTAAGGAGLWAAARPGDAAEPLRGEVHLLDGPYGFINQATATVIDRGRVFVWGGSGSVTGEDGAVYDPGTGAWAETPAPPERMGRRAAAAAWTGERVVVWGGDATVTPGPDRDLPAASFDPATGAWDELAPAPFGLESPHAVALDGGVLFAGGRDDRRERHDSLWLDPATGRWDRIPTPLHVVTVTEVDGRILAAGPAADPPLSAAQDWLVAELDPERRVWSLLTHPHRTSWMVPVLRRGELHAVSLAAPDEPLRALRWDGSSWHETATSGTAAHGVLVAEPDFHAPIAVWTGSELLVGGAQGLTSYTPATGRFATRRDRRLKSLGAPAVWTGRELVVAASQSSEGFVYRP